MPLTLSCDMSYPPEIHLHVLEFHLLAATKQFYELFGLCLSVCLSVCLPACLPVCLSVTPFSPCSYDCIIMKFSGVITNDRSDVHAKGQGQRSKVKVTDVKTQLSRFRTVTPVLIHICWWNDAQSLMLRWRCPIVFQGHPSNFVKRLKKTVIFYPN